jgi:cytochrome c
MSRSLKFALCVILGGMSSTALAGDKTFELGRKALPEEVKAWDIDVRPDGQGLPAGKGTVAEGEALFIEQCAACHGDFGEGAGRWPPLAGGTGSLKSAAPEKTIGSFWPYASSAFDYIHRTMPFGNAQSRTPDQTYALMAFLLNMNDLVPADFELSDKNFTSVEMPNAGAFYPDDRTEAEKHFWNRDPCMKNCKTDVKVIGHARVLDVTPDTENSGGQVD